MSPDMNLGGDDADLFMKQAIRAQLREAEEQLGVLGALANAPGWKLYQTAMKQLSEASFAKAETAPTPHQMAILVGRARALAMAASWPEQMVEHLKEQLGMLDQRPTR